MKVKEYTFDIKKALIEVNVSCYSEASYRVAIEALIKGLEEVK